MAHWTDAVVTNGGVEMLNEWAAGRKLTIVSAKGGTGLIDPTGLLGATDLVEVKQVLHILGEENTTEGKTIQIQVTNREVTEAYELNQVGVFAKLDIGTPNETEERLLFIMQDTHGVTVPAATDGNYLLELFPFIGITNDGRFTVMIDGAGIVTIQYLNERLQHVGGVAKYDITIPSSGWAWEEMEDVGGIGGMDEYNYYRDVDVPDCREDLIPNVTLHKDALDTAKKCGLCPTVQTLAGKVRFWAQKDPDEDMSATLLLMSDGGGIGPNGGGGGGTYVLPIATATTLGGVKIGPGIEVAPDGTITSHTEVHPDQIATAGDADEVLDGVFGDNDTPTT